MQHTFDVVDQKIAEAEFFLRKMAEAGCNMLEFQFYLSAYLAASRTSTLALQQFNHLPGFEAWYSSHRQTLKLSTLAKFFLDARNSHLHGGPYPVDGGMFAGGKATYRFSAKITDAPVPAADVLSACRSYFLLLLDIVYDCYVQLGRFIDPQQYYTKENFARLSRTIDDAEVEIWGWIRTSLIDEGFDPDDRWHELRGKVGECGINHLFYSYLGKVTPQPEEPEHYADFAFTPEELGWLHVPAGYSSIEEYLQELGRLPSEVAEQEGRL